MKNELLNLENLKFSEFADRIAATFQAERHDIIQSVNARGLKGTGICAKLIEDAALRILREKIEKRIDLRRASIESASEDPGSHDLKYLEKAIHEMIDAHCRSTPNLVGKACGLADLADTAEEVRRWQEQAMSLKAEASRKIRIMEMGMSVSEKRSDPEYALIAALPVEFAAIQVMMDSTSEMEKDGIVYIVGSIGSHSVVAFLLTHMGNDFAALGAAKLLASFPSVLDILMVGIAAGVPGQDSISLGDIIVSDKYGVIQYDNVKRVGDKIEIRDTSAKPSAQLIRSIRAIETRSYQEERPWEAHLARASPRFQRPVAGLTRVHYGKIGSGNMLLRDDVLRDDLARNHNLLGFEMEGSGIADAAWDVGRGYLLVRGVSDYADPQKDDSWQPYAALAAAAYARAVIEHLPPSPYGRKDVPPGAAAEVRLNPLESLVNRRVKVGPVVPVAHGNAVYLVSKVDSDFVELAKEGTWNGSIVVPAGLVTVIPAPTGDYPFLQLAGRLQWVTADRRWKFLAEKPSPHDEFGFGRSASDNDQLVQFLLRENKQPRWARKDRIASHLENGYQVVYDDQGLYLRRGDQILLSEL